MIPLAVFLAALGLIGTVIALLVAGIERAGRRADQRRHTRDLAERDAEIERLGDWIDQQNASHAAAAAEWADRCRAANAVAIALDPYAIERTS